MKKIAPASSVLTKKLETSDNHGNRRVGAPLTNLTISVLKLLGKNYSQKIIALFLKTSKQNVSRIKKEHNWRILRENDI